MIMRWLGEGTDNLTWDLNYDGGLEHITEVREGE
jgi:hypothetical protein